MDQRYGDNTVNFKVFGQHESISKEELRCMFHATAAIMELHNKKPKMPLGDNNQIFVLVTNDKRKLGKTKDGKQAVGKAFTKEPRIHIASWLNFNDTFTTAIHETIHIFNKFPKGKIEKLTSTLTAKLKPSITNLYNAMIEGIYQRAAYFAHTQITYGPLGKDFYDSAQWITTECSDKGKKYRKATLTTNH